MYIRQKDRDTGNSNSTSDRNNSNSASNSSWIMISTNNSSSTSDREGFSRIAGLGLRVSGPSTGNHGNPPQHHPLKCLQTSLYL